jgi:hypothetical protein
MSTDASPAGTQSSTVETLEARMNALAERLDER